MTSNAREVVIDRNGGPETMYVRRRRLGQPAAGQLLLRQTAIGLNFVDIYFRRGEKPVPSFPFVNGFEGVGVVEQAGAGTSFLSGDRVAYLLEPGSYASHRLLPAHRAIRLPGWLSDVEAAAVLLKGLTADYLVHTIHHVSRDDVVLVHAAAGGVGSFLCQWTRHLGARVFGTVGTEAKRERALSLGCEAVFVTAAGDWLSKFMEATSGSGATIIYDGVGRDTFLKSLAALAVRGKLMAFGSASGNPEPLDIALLNEKSVTIANPGVQHFIHERDELDRRVSRLFVALEIGTLSLPTVTRFALDDAASAHRALEGRVTTGSVVLIP
jgi:NADPH2:quinone reductase